MMSMTWDANHIDTDAVTAQGREEGGAGPWSTGDRDS